MSAYAGGIHRLLERASAHHTPHRRILIIEDDSSIRNILYVLLAGLNIEGEIAYDGKHALAMINRQQYDAILLDLRCYNVSPEEVLAGIRKIRPNLLGRVLVITGEVADPATLEFFNRFAVSRVTKSRLVSDLWPSLRTVLAG